MDPPEVSSAGVINLVQMSRSLETRLSICAIWKRIFVKNQCRGRLCAADAKGQETSAVLALARKASSALMSSPASLVNRGLAKAVMISFCLWDATSP